MTSKAALHSFTLLLKDSYGSPESQSSRTVQRLLCSEEVPANLHRAAPTRQEEGCPPSPADPSAMLFQLSNRWGAAACEARARDARLELSPNAWPPETEIKSVLLF